MGICQYCSLLEDYGFGLDPYTYMCCFSPEEAIMHTLFMKKHLEVGLYASCLFSVL